MWVALAIVFCTVLYLIDKNQKWRACLGIAKWCMKALVGVAVVIALNIYIPDAMGRWVIIGLIVGVTILFEWLKKQPDKTHE
jgi:hypothetical protein